jgi:outer membrane protein assembly factor BamB
VYFGSSDGKVYALDAESGEPRWNPFETGKEVWSPPVLHAGTLFVTSFDRRLYAVDAETGREQWSFSTGAGIGSPAVVVEDEGLVLVAGFDSQLRAIDLETHEERWSVKASNWFWTRPLVRNGVVYAGGLDGKVYAVDVGTGEERWGPFSTEKEIRAAPVIADELLIVIDRGGNVYGLDPESGTQVAGSPLKLDAKVLADPVVLPNGDVAVVTTDGELVRIDAGALEIVSRKKLTQE